MERVLVVELVLEMALMMANMMVLRWEAGSVPKLDPE